ncbi:MULTISPECIES: hypothetical protein [Actinoplanes]|uniref:hypothetical protein n=1 Tax=Actinoplanes TaxID=1865 RepID=UPI0005F2A7E7|nr:MULTISPECIES: hypothetical protein [Actinoplanes]GLY05786.1 hypothetical protein Acsp01_61650 [Actinoplanes sp. NBRC 101535]
MKRLSDLMDDARTEAPPMGFDVNDLVTAGKRRQMRRTTGWALAAVVAVATAIGVPQIATRASTEPALPAAKPSPTATPSPSVTPATAKVFPSAFVFRGYQTADFTVTDPDGMGLSGSGASITRLGTTKAEASLEVYVPGAVPVRTGTAKVVKAAPVGGREAYYLREGDRESLYWEYADNALAVISGLGAADMPKMTRAEQMQVAKGFALGGGKNLRVPFRVGSVPQGYQLQAVGTTSAYLMASGQIREILDRGDRSPGMGPVREQIQLNITESNPYNEQFRECDIEALTCRKMMADDRYIIEFNAVDVSVEEFRAFIEAVEPADPDDPSTWTDVTEAFPASVQVSLE